MLWAIRKFGWAIAIAATLLGLIYLPTNWLARDTAFQTLGKVWTVGNREILAEALCMLSLGRLAYLDLHRVALDERWPELRLSWKRSALKLISVIFRKSKRDSELMALANTREMQRVYLASERLRQLRERNLDRLAMKLVAQEVLDERQFWNDVPSVPNPKTLAEMEPYSTEFQRSMILRTGRCGSLDFIWSDIPPQIESRIWFLDNKYPGYHFSEIFYQQRNAWSLIFDHRKVEKISFFETCDVKQKWKNAIAAVESFNLAATVLKNRLNEQIDILREVTIPSKFLPRLLAYVESEIHPRIFPG